MLDILLVFIIIHIIIITILHLNIFVIVFSCSGRYVAVYWPESQLYIVLKINLELLSNNTNSINNSNTNSVLSNRLSSPRKGSLTSNISYSSSSSAAQSKLPRGKASQSNNNNSNFSVTGTMDPSSPLRLFTELERGMCYSIAWVAVSLEDTNDHRNAKPTATNNDNNNNDDNNISTASSKPQAHGQDVSDILCILTPSKKIGNTAKKRSSLLGGIFDKKKSAGGVIPSMFVVKETKFDDTIGDGIVNPGAPEDIAELIGGGPYICISSPVIEEASSGKMKSVSKVESDAAAAAAMAAMSVDDKSKTGAASTSEFSLNDLAFPPTGAAANEVAGMNAFVGIASTSNNIALKSQFYRAVYVMDKVVLGSASAGAKANLDNAKTTSTTINAHVNVDHTDNDHGNNSNNNLEGISVSTSQIKAILPKLQFVPVGPSFPRVASVNWDLVSGQVACVAAEDQSRITIMSISFPSNSENCSEGESSNIEPGTNNNNNNCGQFEVVDSIQIPTTSALHKIQSCWWYQGTLFSMNSTGIFAIFTNKFHRDCGNPPCSRVEIYAVASHQVRYIICIC